MTYLIAFILFLFSISFNGVQGTLPHQPPLLSSMNHNGQVYYCVDFYRQPAFDHPMLKNHLPKVRRLNSTTFVQGVFNITARGCPDGSVPVFRSSDDSSLQSFPPTAQVHCYAIVRTNNTYSKFYGSSAEPSLNKPKAEGYQWSTGRIKLSNGYDSIEAGWMVYPAFFKDNEAHLYARFNAGPTECLNLNCPGFVQVDKEIALGGIPDAYSTIGGPQFVWKLSIDKHTDDGNWWLSMTLEGSGTHEVGYWPSSLFTRLKDAATMVEWGGEINNPGTVEPAPYMGNGLKADYDMTLSAFLQQVTVVDEDHNRVEPQGTEIFSDCPELYTVNDWGSSNRASDYGRVVSYGGS